MNKIYKITKHFQGGQGIYYALMSNKKQMKKGYWDYQLQDWGEGTNGGHNYGYRIHVNQVKNIPKIVKYKHGKDCIFKKAGYKNATKLHFNKYYLIKA